ncbi:MAG: hypothetical protein ACKVZ6_16400 [Kineosporiaceae bacterium]
MRAPHRSRPADRFRRKVLVLVTGVALAATPFVVGSLSPASAAGTYVVSPKGSDSNNGSEGAPWRTLSASFKKLGPGDRLVVRGGTYTEQIKVTPTKGTAADPVRVVAATGEQPVVSGLLWLKGADYWTLDGIDVTWGPGNTSSQHMVKMTGGTGWRITNAEIWGARSYAAVLVAGTPSKWMIDRNYIHDTYKSNSTNQDHLIYVNGSMGGGVIERNLLARSPNGRGLKIGPPSASSSPIGNVVVRYNTFYDNQGPSNLQLSYGASGVNIYRNVFDISGKGKPNITAYKLNGKGNLAKDNVGWHSTGVLDEAPGLTDGGGNVMADPGTTVNGAGEVSTTAFAGYGRTAPTSGG